MKKNWITIFLVSIVTSISASNGDEKELFPMKSRFKDVKVYAQASTSSPSIASLEKEQEVLMLRKSPINGGVWTIVYVEGKPGYVLNSEIYGEEKNSQQEKISKRKSKRSSLRQI